MLFKDTFITMFKDNKIKGKSIVSKYSIDLFKRIKIFKIKKYKWRNYIKILNENKIFKKNAFKFYNNCFLPK